MREAGAHAESAYPDEACGLIVRGESGELRAVRSRNISANPREHFEVEPGELLSALKAGRLHGFYHSHPDGPAVPSAEDLERAALWGAEIEWTVIPVEKGRAGEARTFRLGGADSRTVRDADRPTVDRRPSTVD